MYRNPLILTGCLLLLLTVARTAAAQENPATIALAGGKLQIKRRPVGFANDRSRRSSSMSS